MSAFRRYILLALLTGFSGPGFPTAARAAGTAPDAPDFNFTHYNSGNSELPYDLVNKIVQDSQGFIWFGTASGLSRFDGIRFRNYTKEEMGLKSAYVITLCTDSEGNLWIGTDRGVSVYDVDRDRFEPFLRESDIGTVIRNKANVIRRGPDGVMWISVNNQGLFAYDPRTQTLRNHFFENGRQTLPVNIRALHVDGDNGLWIGLFYHSFLYIGHDSTDRLRLNDAREITEFRNDNVEAVSSAPDDSETIYVASARRGLCLLNRDCGQIRTLIPVPSRGFTPEDLHVDREGIVWMSTSEGVYRYDPRTDSARKLASDSRNRFSLSDSHAFAVFIDASDGIWIGTNVGGVNYCGAFQQQFEKYHAADGRSLEDCLVRGFADDGAGRIWIATENEGLLLYDTERRTVADNTIFYYNVPAGTYSLEIRSLASGTAQPIGHEPLSIVVEQRFYKSTAAIGLYLLLFAGVLIAAFKVYYKRAIAREKRKHENYKKQKEAELFQQKLTFFSNIVHEIKTPLTVIHTPLQQIQASGHLSPADRDNLQAICNGTHYLDQLVRELLDFVRVEKRGYKLDCKPMNIVERTGFLCSTFQEIAKARNLRLSFTAERDNIRIDADESAMNKILNNLLHNALKYAESYIEVNVRSHDGTATVSITNDGEPISPEQRSEIFKPFVQYDKSPGSRSFGIGLSLARSLAEMHAGTLELADDTLRTTFVLTLPAAAPLPETAAGQEPPAPQDRSLPLLLLVEDNRELTAYLKHKLAADYRVIAVHAAEKAVAVLQEQEVDIVVTDIALPGTNGIELCRTISSDFDLSYIPVIVTSAISDTATKIACMEAGASTYIEKPFGLDYLEACIRAILDKRARLKKSYQNTQEPLDPKQFGLHSADEEFLRRIDELIMQHLNEPAFSSKQIEEALFLSRSTLIRKVRALLDTTPNDYLRSKRLSIAAQLLAQNKCRISEVCFSVGFNSPSYFAKCFKEQFGVSPAEYQKQ